MSTCGEGGGYLLQRLAIHIRDELRCIALGNTPDTNGQTTGDYSNYKGGNIQANSTIHVILGAIEAFGGWLQHAPTCYNRILWIAFDAYPASIRVWIAALN